MYENVYKMGLCYDGFFQGIFPTRRATLLLNILQYNSKNPYESVFPKIFNSMYVNILQLNR